MSKYEKQVLITVVVLLFFALGDLCIKYYNKSIDLQERNEELITTVENLELESGNKSEDFKLHDCYFCGSHEVELRPINDRFYIHCPGCEIESDFFDNKLELISYWNSAVVEDSNNEAK